MLKHALFSSLSVLSAVAFAQASQQVTVTGRIQATQAEVGGFGGVPLERSPFAATVLDADQLSQAGARSIADLTRLDAALADAYNAEGYWQSLNVRGFQLDNHSNYLRDGLPVNAEAVIPLDNKQRLEVLKGTSGLQAGVSAPGGLVDFVVKRPTVQDIGSALLEWRQPGSVLTAVDVSRRFGDQQTFGLRVNAAYERLDPQVRDARGHRELAAVAGEWRATRDTLVEVEYEHSRQQQPSVPGFSMLGAVLPDARSIDPRTNLNDQPWSLPVVFDGDTGSLRFTQRLNEDWRFVAHAQRQLLRTQDRVAFPFGCSAEGDYSRFCSDGTYDLYDFRSEGERRTSDAVDLSIQGRARAAGITHALTAGVMQSRFQSRLHGQAYNYVGSGNIEGTLFTPPDPTNAYPETNADERSTELYARDAMQLNEQWSLWAGLRHSALRRQSIGTDGSASTRYDQSFTTPWAALSWQLAPRTMVYVSAGQGVETALAPNLATYTNAGQPLPALKSRQVEVGVKHGSTHWDAGAALFDITRPQYSDLGDCSADASCTRVIDGKAHHQGLEVLASWRGGAWQLHGSAMWLKARTEGASDTAMNGLRPANVAEKNLRLQAVQQLETWLPGASWSATLVSEGDRMATPDNSVRVPGWTRVDLAARYSRTMGATTFTWQLALDNAADRRAWKEAPYQYGHVYLFPMAPRTWRVSLQADF